MPGPTHNKTPEETVNPEQGRTVISNLHMEDNGTHKCKRLAQSHAGVCGKDPKCQALPPSPAFLGCCSFSWESIGGGGGLHLTAPTVSPHPPCPSRSFQPSRCCPQALCCSALRMTSPRDLRKCSDFCCSALVSISLVKAPSSPQGTKNKGALAVIIWFLRGVVHAQATTLSCQELVVAATDAAGDRIANEHKWSQQLE